MATSNWKYQLIRGLKVLMIFSFAVLFIAILVSAKVRIGDVVCNNVVINIKDKGELGFLAEPEILDYINNHGLAMVLNKKIKDINADDIEKRIEENDYVENAEVFTNFEGSIKVNIDQKNPVYRVFNNQGVSYYVCKDGTHIPISSKFTPRLIVATGYIPLNSNLEKQRLVEENLYELVEFIEQNAFWRAMIGQIYVEKNGDFVLYPKLEGHKIIIGNADELEQKFRKLQIFYKEALKHINWQQYESINLKYKDQIICTKK